MERILPILCLCLSLTVYAGDRRGYIPQAGDLLFEVAADSPMSAAVAAATAQGDSLKFSHVAIVGVEADSVFVIEATGRGGVMVSDLDCFLDSATAVSGRPGVVVKRLASHFPAAEAVARAVSHIGAPYDWTFLPGNGAYYCSELVYECFLDASSGHIFPAQPMNFLDDCGRMPQFWTELFERLGMDVPQGVPGTNPNDMSKYPALREVYRFF